MGSALRLPRGRVQSLQDWVASRDERVRMHPEELGIMLKKVASRLLQVQLFSVFCHCQYGLTNAIVTVDMAKPKFSAVELDQEQIELSDQ